MVMLELEAMGLDRVRTELSAQYVDHNLLQADYRNADDHLFLHSACQRFGLWYSKPGNGVSHPVHMQRFGIPGKTLLGSDSHTCAAGSLGHARDRRRRARGRDGDGGRAVPPTMPQIWGVGSSVSCPDWVSAKDVILEMLRRHDVSGGRGPIIEYHGPGLAQPVGDGPPRDREHGRRARRDDDGVPVRRRRCASSCARRSASTTGPSCVADAGATYDLDEQIDLADARAADRDAVESRATSCRCARSPAGRDLSGVHRFVGEPRATATSRSPPMIVEGRHAARSRLVRRQPDVAPDPRGPRRRGQPSALIPAGARLHQAGCNGLHRHGPGAGDGPDQPAHRAAQLPRPLRHREDKVYLCQPGDRGGVGADRRDHRSARAASALSIRRPVEPDQPRRSTAMLVAPLPADGAASDSSKGRTSRRCRRFEPLPATCEAPVLLKLGDDVSTDEILPAGARVLPFRSNIPRSAEFAFEPVDESYATRGREERAGPHVIVAGENYGQGSSREHAAIAPRYLGLHAVIAKCFARIHWQNLVNFGVLPSSSSIRPTTTASSRATSSRSTG